MDDIGNILQLEGLFSRVQDLSRLLSQASTSYQSLHTRIQALVTAVQETHSVPVLPSVSPETYLWKLTLAETAPRFVCKERSFRLYFSLQQVGAVELEKEQEVVAEVKVWNGSMTRVLDTNLANLPIVSVKATKTRYLSSTKVHNLSLRLKLNEVSSHFERGVFTLQIEGRIPKRPDYEGRVQPCLIHNLVVRAKAATCMKDMKREGRDFD